MIDVIIPAYNAHETIMQTLSSIAYQHKREMFNVYIVNDASKKDYSKEVEFFSKYINVKELKMKKNGGPGVARQYGIDNSNSPYITFIDADDVYASPLAISHMYERMLEEESDVLISDFYQETDDEVLVHHDDTIWMHGKMYRRQFLIDNNIRFNGQRCNEDNGFNQLLLLLDPVESHMDEKTYIWRNNKNSITRVNNHEYNYTGLESYIFNINYALNEALDRGCNVEKFSNLAFSALVSSYCYYLQFIDKKEIIPMVKLTRETKRLYDMYPLDDEQRNELYKSQVDSAVYWERNNDVFNPVITFDNYLRICERNDD